MAWMRETRIRTFMQMELEACLDEVDWLRRCHNYAVHNCPEEKYLPRPLPIPPDCIENLQSRLVKVKEGVLPPTLKMIPKMYYHLPVHQAPVTSPAVQPDDMIGRHRDGEHNPLERLEASEEEENVVADRTSSTDQGEEFVFKSRSGWTTKHRKSPLAISSWRFSGNNKRQQRRA